MTGLFSSKFAPVGAAVGIALLLSSAAVAHHGWSWAEADQIELKGTLSSIYIGPPHPTLKVETSSDGVWTVELGNPTQTRRAGFVEGSAKVGDAVTAIGNRSQDRQEKRMKAVRLIIGAKTYDIYPERIRQN